MHQAHSPPPPRPPLSLLLFIWLSNRPPRALYKDKNIITQSPPFPQQPITCVRSHPVEQALFLQPWLAEVLCRDSPSFLIKWSLVPMPAHPAGCRQCLTPTCACSLLGTGTGRWAQTSQASYFCSVSIDLTLWGQIHRGLERERDLFRWPKYL